MNEPIRSGQGAGVGVGMLRGGGDSLTWWGGFLVVGLLVSWFRGVKDSCFFCSCLGFLVSWCFVSWFLGLLVFGFLVYWLLAFKVSKIQ